MGCALFSFINRYSLHSCVALHCKRINRKDAKVLYGIAAKGSTERTQIKGMTQLHVSNFKLLHSFKQKKDIYDTLISLIYL